MFEFQVAVGSLADQNRVQFVTKVAKFTRIMLKLKMEEASSTIVTTMDACLAKKKEFACQMDRGPVLYPSAVSKNFVLNFDGNSRVTFIRTFFTWDFHFKDAK